MLAIEMINGKSCNNNPGIYKLVKYRGVNIGTSRFLKIYF